MLEDYPPDIRDFVIQKIAEGTFRTADEFAVEAASLYRELDSRHRTFRAQVAAGIQELENGEFSEFSETDSLDAFFEQIKCRGRAALAPSPPQHDSAYIKC
jgi:hypothetical protein